jgi:3-dehydroquinate dehydratase-1
MSAPVPLLLKKQPLVVGALCDPAALDLDIASTDCDLIELRLDALGAGARVKNFRSRHEIRLPILLTARHPAEGGARERTCAERLELLQSGLATAAAIDVEIRSLDELAPVWSEAGGLGVKRIASFHDFDSTPGLEVLRDKLAAALAAGADVAKFAFHLREARDLAVVSALLRGPAALPLSVMGMGPLAPASRLLAMQLGSCLNYGYLGGAPTAPGQWPAGLLREVRDASPLA